MVKRKGRRGQKRKSARIKALEALKKAKKVNNNNNASLSTEEEQNQEISCDQHNAALLSPPLTAAKGVEAASSRQCLPEATRRGRKKKRLDEVAFTSVGPTTHQNGEQAKLEVPPANNVLPSKQWMPEKRILEFILDILQRRDTHEIFAQPVDRDEVEGYYSIIHDPMDFGTMRAKLQEEIYTTLEQFENDVFLITNNAMLFNSSTTIYFRQARAIHELAKRVFYTLKTEPQKIELEFSLTRKRSGRKPRSEYCGPSVMLGAKLRANNQAYCGSAGANRHDNEILPGCRYGRNMNFSKTERRQTYTPQYSTVNEDSTVSMVYSSSKQLVPGNGGIGYKESLLRFAQDLGPIAQKVAHQKLRCLTQTPTPLISSTASQQQPSCTNGVMNGVMNSVAAAVDNPQGNHSTTSKGKNILINDNPGIDSSTSRGRMELGISRPHIANALSKGKSVLIGDGIDPYGGPLCKETLPCGGNDGLSNANCGQNIQSQLRSSYPPNDPVKPSNSASTPQPALFEFLSSSNRRPKSAVYPSTVIRPSGTSQPMALMHGPGRESKALLDTNSGASLSPMSQHVQWSLPTPWGPLAIDDFRGTLMGNNGFMQQEPQLQVDQYWQAKSSNESPLGPSGLPRHQMGSQVASAAPYVQLQPSGVNPLGQDAVLQQEILSQSGYTQLQPGLLNLLGQDIFVQPNPLGQDDYMVQGQQLVLPQYMQQQPSNLSPLGRNGIQLGETQPGLPHQGLMSDPIRYFSESEVMKDHQQNTNAEFLNFQQQFLRGTTSQHPDLDLRLQSRYRRQ